MLTINPEDVNPLDLPSLPLESRYELPDIPALYFVIDEDDEILYIGRTISLVERWQGWGHGIFGYLEELSVDNVRIAWLKCDRRLINSSEPRFINHFKRLLNYGHQGKRCQEMLKSNIPHFLTPQKFSLYCYGTYVQSPNPINGRYNWQYGENYRACLIQNLKELASEFQRIKCASDSEMVSLWAGEWLQFIQEGLDDRRGFCPTISNCKTALRLSCIISTKLLQDE